MQDKSNHKLKEINTEIENTNHEERLEKYLNAYSCQMIVISEGQRYCQQLTSSSWELVTGKKGVNSTWMMDSGE